MINRANRKRGEFLIKIGFSDPYILDSDMCAYMHWIRFLEFWNSYQTHGQGD